VVVDDDVMHNDVVNLMVDHHMVDDRTVVDVVDDGGVTCRAAGEGHSGGGGQEGELAHGGQAPVGEGIGRSRSGFQLVL
jgi:hypothetical protein